MHSNQIVLFAKSIYTICTFLKYESETLESYYIQNLNKIIICIIQMQIISSKHVKFIIN